MQYSSWQEWFTSKELADLSLPGLPETKRGINNIAAIEGWRAAGQEYPQNPEGYWKKVDGGFAYRLCLLPSYAQSAAILRLSRLKRQEEAQEKPELDASDAWKAYERASDKFKETARERLCILQAVNELVSNGNQKDFAISEVAARYSVSSPSIYNWFSKVQNKEKSDWVAYLVPTYKGRVKREKVDEALEALKTDYLRNSQPSFESCYRRVCSIAAQKGWKIQSSANMKRRFLKEVQKERIVLAREGEEKLKRLFPAQKRSRDHFHALEAVNADGHKFDVFVKTKEGKIIRPVMVAFQDLYSNKILGWRLGESEHRGLTLLAFGDLVEKYGIPTHCWFDNGRAFASKWITGQIPNRYRFKIKEDEIDGVFKLLQIEVHWTQPYSGQSKPIERAFRDLADTIAKHPVCEGAYTGNKPTSKPENYGTKAVEWDVFEQLVADGIAEHNARKGRKSDVCAGKFSFDEVFFKSIEASSHLIRMPSAEQRRLWLMAAESVMVRASDACVHFMGNRYWGEISASLAGTRITVRFDPDKLHDGLHVYSYDGNYLGKIACVENQGFSSQDAAKDHNQKRRKYFKAAREIQEIEQQLDLEQYIAMLPKMEEIENPTRKVVRGVFVNKSTNLAQKLDEETQYSEANYQKNQMQETVDAFSQGVIRLFANKEGF